MDEWQKELWSLLETTTMELVETTASELEELLQNVGETVEAITDEMTDNFNYCFEKFKESLGPEVENYFRDFWDAFDISSLEEELTRDYGVQENEFLGITKVHPNPETHPACVGCQHYHGYAYGGNLLVCGIHPYGWDDETCPDWDGTSSR
jgi:hypothetical protein